MTLIKTLRRFVLPAVVAATGFALLPTHAAAQSTYCNGALAADAVYSTVASAGSKSRVDYFLQLRNTGTTDLMVNARFVLTNPNHPIVNRLGTTVKFVKYSSQKLLLASETLNNPAGNGKLAESEIRPAIIIACQK